MDWKYFCTNLNKAGPQLPEGRGSDLSWTYHLYICGKRADDSFTRVKAEPCIGKG